MNDGAPQPRSIAAELAVLFLRELEPRVPNDPELLVSTEAVLSLSNTCCASPRAAKTLSGNQRPTD
jgi:hypothetical protein